MRTSLTFLLLIVCVPSLGLAQSTVPAENDDQAEIEQRDRLIRVILDEGYNRFKQEVETIAKEQDKTTATSLVRQILLYDHVDFTLEDIQNIQGAAIAVCGTEAVEIKDLVYPLFRSMKVPGVHDVIDKHDDGEFAVRLAKLICARPSPLHEEDQFVFNIYGEHLLGHLKHLARPAVPILLDAYKTYRKNPDDEIYDGDYEFGIDEIVMKELASIGEHANEAVPFLLPIVQNPESGDRYDAITTLAAIGSEPAKHAKLMIAYIADPDESEGMKIAAAKYLAKHPEHEKDAIPVLIEAWKTPYNQKSVFWCNMYPDGVYMRHWASAPLLSYGKDAVPAIKHELTNNKSARIREYADECRGLMSELFEQESLDSPKSGLSNLKDAEFHVLIQSRDPAAVPFLLKEFEKTSQELRSARMVDLGSLSYQDKQAAHASREELENKYLHLFVSLHTFNATPQNTSEELLRIAGVVDRKISGNFNARTFSIYLQVADTDSGIALASHLLKITRTDSEDFRKLVRSVHVLKDRGESLRPLLWKIIDSYDPPGTDPADLDLTEYLRNYYFRNLAARVYFELTPKDEHAALLRTAIDSSAPYLLNIALCEFVMNPPEDEEARERLREIASDEKRHKTLIHGEYAHFDLRDEIIWALRGFPPSDDCLACQLAD